MIKYNGKDVIPRIDGKEISRVMYNGKQIYPNNNVIEIQKADAIAGDICAYDGTNKRFFRFVDEGATDDIKKYTPIGVVVIPTSHDVYGTGECGVMSLKPMSCDTPSIGGTSEQLMCWGIYNIDISELPNLDKVPTGNTSNGIPTGQDKAADLPTDRFVQIQCAHDTNTYYPKQTNVNPAPSPYLTDGSRNPGYYQITSPSSSNNALADFDGKGNTQKIIAQRGIKDYNLWKPNKTTRDDYPAASCCDMFYTEGTSQGDWYLPAMGELGYIAPSYKKINNIMNEIRTVYGLSVGVDLELNFSYFSSTEYSNFVRILNSGHLVNFGSKGNSNYVRAFLRVGIA